MEGGVKKRSFNDVFVISPCGQCTPCFGGIKRMDMLCVLFENLSLNQAAWPALEWRQVADFLVANRGYLIRPAWPCVMYATFSCMELSTLYYSME